MAQAPDRRHRRRQETIEEIVAVALSIMAEEGAGGLSLGEVARRVGVRTPSLYVYFDSKNALYDEIFGRGWRILLELLEQYEPRVKGGDDPVGAVRKSAEEVARWAVANPAYAQLMFWRPVPGFEPSAAAYGPAVEVMTRTSAMLETLQGRGVLRDGVDISEAAGVWTSLVSGVISQQLSNAPRDPYETGTFTRLLPHMVDMYLAYFGSEGRTDDSAGTSNVGARASGDRSASRRGARDGAVRSVAQPAAKSRRP
jgi:AcrR family transcriptional regulator